MAYGRKTGGRKKGVQNKATVERERFVKRSVQAALEEGVLPLDIMLRRMRGDASITEAQFAAACAAAPYIHPKLSTVEMNATVRRDISDLTEAELVALAGGRESPDGADESPRLTH